MEVILINFKNNLLNGTIKLLGSNLNISICEVPDNRKAMVTVISDDGDYESGLIFNSILQELGIHATVAGVVKTLIPHLDEWKKMEEDGNIEIISHSYSHLKINEKENITKEQVFHEYIDSKNFFEANFKTPSFCFVTPNNSTNSTGFYTFETHGFLAVRQGTRGENSLNPNFGREAGQWLNLKTRGIGDVNNTLARNAWVDTAILNHAWLIEMWHNISPNGDSGYQPISTKMAKEHLIYITDKEKRGEIWVAPFTQAVSYIYKRQNSKLEGKLVNNIIEIYMAKLNENLPWQKFNMPLTVSIDLPSNLNTKNLIILYNGKKMTYRIDDNEKIIIELNDR